MRRLTFFLSVLLLIVGSIVAQPTEPVTDVPSRILQVVDSEPLPGEEIDENNTLVIYFDRDIVCNGDELVSLSPAISGNVSTRCVDNRLEIDPPEGGFSSATSYTLTVTNNVTGADGAQLAEPYTLQFDTTGFLQVTEVIPESGSVDVSADTMLTIIFNRPVVPLGIIEDMENLPDPLRFSPSVEGDGEWINTSIYTFQPDPAWAGGTTYTITVDPSLVAVNGAAITGTESWTFTTALPEVVSVMPLDAAGRVPLDTDVEITFNQPMDQGSVEGAFQLRPAGGNAVAGEYEWADDLTGFRFMPDELLQLDTPYEVIVGEMAQGIAGGALTVPLQTNFVTVPFPAIIGTSPNDGETNVQPFGGVTLFFASPMDRTTLNDKIIIEPEPWREPDFYYQDYDDSLQVSFPMEPSTTYTITVEPGMADPYGNEIESPFTFSFTTDRYPPDVQLQVPGPVGFYNAARDETQLFLTHRNVSEIDLSLFTVPLDTFVRRMTDSEIFDPTDRFSPASESLLRSWQIESVAPENARRYELLSLATVGSDGQTGTTVVCEGAAAPRVKVGDSAIVISDPDPLRARSAPVEGDVVELLYRDYVFSIVGGPVCENDLLWWEIELRGGETAWVAEGTPEEYFFDLRSASATTPVTIPQDFTNGDALSPGVYFLEAETPETRQAGFRASQHFLVVATANLVVNTSVDSMTVWATDVNTALPLANVPLQVLDSANTVVGEGVTDADGLARIDIPPISDLYVRRMVVLDTDDHFGLGFTDWTEGIDPWRFGLPSEFYPRQYSLYLYTDRPIYRPGQPVYFRGVLRNKDDVSYTPPDRTTVPVQIFDDRGEVIYENELPLTEFGTFSDTYMIDADAPLGFYRISVELPSQVQFQSEGGSVAFNVAEFRLPEFQVEVTPVEEEVVQGDTVAVEVDSRYFFGGSVASADVQYNVISNPYFFNYEGPGGSFSFSDFDPDAGPGEIFGSSRGLIASGTGTTDAQGMLTIEIPADLEDATQSQTFTIEAVVTDESDQAVAGRADVVVHQGEIYIGVRPAEYVGTAGSDTLIEFIAVDWNSLPVANQTIDLEIVERRWSSVQEEDPSGRTIWTWEVEEIPVTTAEVTTDEDGQAEYVFIPPHGGIFQFTITSMDVLGNEVRASTTMWVSGTEYISWRQQNSNRIDLITDKDEYTVGETAEVLITSPFQGRAEALISVLRGDTLSVEHVTMESNSYVHEIEISEEFAPNVYVSVVLVKGVDETNPIAAFRVGMAQLTVDRERKLVDILVTPDRDTAGPRETVTYTVQTRDYAGNPVSAEVGIGLTDLASLSIADPNSIPIADYFYGLQGLAVRISTILTINTDQITQTVLDTIKGGGGGFGEGGIFDIREDFVDTAYWNAHLVTGEDGLATFEVTLPDNLTTWRLDARAVTLGADGEMLVGQDTFDLLSTKPLLIRPVTPRFAVIGDEIVLGAVINNNTDAPLTVEVALQGTGVEFEGDVAQSLEIPAGGSVRVNWPVVVGNVEALDLTFAVATADGELGDASKPPLGQGDERLLPVYRYEAPEITGTGGVLEPPETLTEAIALPQRFDVTQGELTVNLERSLAATSLNSLEALHNHPYDNIEATVSRFLPNIMTVRALAQLDLADEALRSQLDIEVQLAIQRLYGQQHVDGGWGWHIRDRSHVLVTAWALIGLAEAQTQGYAIDPGVISRAQSFLRDNFITPGLNLEAWRLDRQAFILYALARSGDPDVGRTVALYDSRERLSIYAQALLAITLDIIGEDNEARINTLVSDVVDQAILSANGAHWEEAERDFWNWNTNTRTTAIVLQMLVRLNPDSSLIPNVVRWLMVARDGDMWETTQETAWSVTALTDWMVASGELNGQYDFSATFNDAVLFEGMTSPDNVTEPETLVIQVADMLRDQANTLTLSTSDGQGKLYYTAYLRAFLPVPEIEPVNRGIIVQRRYTLLDDPDRESITSAEVGDLVQARLTIIAPNDLHFVVVEDPIPAGADAVDPQLETSQQVGTRPGLDTSDPVSFGWGWWWFSDIEFRDEKVVLNSTYLPAGTYEYVYTIRPGLAGTYNVIPPTAREFYFPDVFGRGAGSTFVIEPAAS